MENETNLKLLDQFKLLVMTTQERIDKALGLRKEGYNCAQTVMMAFPDATGVDDNTAAVMTASLGGGVACGEICGVANAIAIAQGFITGDDSPTGKKKAMPAAKHLLDEFSRPFGGCLTCRELKGKCGKTCEELIAAGINILDNSLNLRN